MYTLYIWTGCRRCSRATQWANENNHQVNSGIHYGAIIEPVWRCTLEAVIEIVWRCTWRPQLSEIGNAIAGHDQATCGMHLEASIRRD
jgi:hypothetical protein